MEKVIRELRIMMTAIGIILLPLLSFLMIVSLTEKHLFASLGYGSAVLGWLYVLYQLAKIAKLLKDDEDK